MVRFVIAHATIRAADTAATISALRYQDTDETRAYPGSHPMLTIPSYRPPSSTAPSWALPPATTEEYYDNRPIVAATLPLSPLRRFLPSTTSPTSFLLRTRSYAHPTVPLPSIKGGNDELRMKTEPVGV